MKHFKNILLIFDKEHDGQDALNHALTLSRKNKAHLTIVGIIPDLAGDVELFSGSISPAYIQELLIKDTIAQINQFLPPNRRKGVKVSIKVLTGRPFIEIIREVIRSSQDLVIITNETPVGLKHMLFGSTTMNLMRKCPCPVWVTKPTKNKRRMKILAAVDFDPSDKKQNLLNEKILGLATSLAQQGKNEVHIVHTWTMYGESMLSSTRMKLPAKELKDMLGATENLHKELLSGLVDKFPYKKKHVHLLKGEPEGIISSLLKQKKIDLLVMGTLSRKGLSGFFIGNTAERILSEVNCSVLTVKPEGFISPVKLR